MADLSRRRDAARNRTLLLDAARRIVAEQGPDAPLDEIARAAGVSRTTLHRHFADREELAFEVLRDNVTEIESRASALAGVASGAEDLYHHLLDVQRDVPWLAHMVAKRDSRETGELAERTLAAMEPLIGRARELGRIYPSVTAQDILLTLPMVMTVLFANPQGNREPSVDRARAILHRGLFTTEPPS
ncbi:TetR/AcrR family transcriptional regulator [Brevibacterium marinum]|uniref:AcrR family transcriptional regulator n=1 Tax=Brevibacterium marinum TaxID=418643 RepID=A0A846S4D4_9MICO|nr:TetR/AcrR family transcriptional regulator [Brevibacterium marinum]NJC55717.1 AcrR family transcriptional regulator [Brevibacterium marinum]